MNTMEIICGLELLEFHYGPGEVFADKDIIKWRPEDTKYENMKPEVRDNLIASGWQWHIVDDEEDFGYFFYDGAN